MLYRKILFIPLALLCGVVGLSCSLRSSVNATKLKRVLVKNDSAHQKQVYEYRDTQTNALLRREEFNKGVRVGQTLFKNGKVHGVQRHWFPNGKLALQYQYRDGLMDGTNRNWDAKGRLTGRMELKQGTGFAYGYSSKGSLDTIAEIHRSTLEGYLLSLFPNGQLKAIRKFKAKRQHGFTFLFNPDGSPQALVGSEHGPTIFFYPKYEVNYFIDNKSISDDGYKQYITQHPQDSTVPPYYGRYQEYQPLIIAELQAIQKQCHTALPKPALTRLNSQLKHLSESYRKGYGKREAFDSRRTGL